MSCPDENLIANFVAGTVSAAERSQVEQHIDRCAACTSLLATLARLASDRQQAASVDTSSSFRTSPFEHPRSIDRYAVERLLGIGAWGAVYEAIDPTLTRRVAIKVVRADRKLAGVGDHNAALLQEARAMAQLAHPNIVPIFEVGMAPMAEHGPSIYLVMELVRGQTLTSFLATAPGPSKILPIFLEVAQGLAAAHDRQIYHRDFKPDNVLLGADGRPRITDFGLALHTGSDPTDGVHLFRGTPAYAAPEQVFGYPVDGRADQFAFAVSLFHALCGEFPFRMGSVEQLRWIYATHRAKRLPALSEVAPGVAVVLERALSVDPALRYRDMREFGQALHSAVHSTDKLHIGVNAAIQVAAIPIHGLILLKWAAQMRDRTSATKDSAVVASTAQPESTSGDLLTLAYGGVAVLLLSFVLAWMVAGLAWAPLNAWALVTRRRWGRVSTIVYASLAALTCVGLPYAIYAVWSLRRPGVKALFLQKPGAARA